MEAAIKLSIVVGVQHAQGNLVEILRALAPAVHPQVELLFCHTAADPDVPALVAAQGQIKVVRGPAGSLIPQLWRDGILAARGERVATTTAHCIPTADWVDRLIAADIDNTAVGGVIENDPNADANSRAVFLLRYAAYAPPQTRRYVPELAADNAIYRRSDLLRHDDLLRLGFWEPWFHKRFRAEGIQLLLDPTLRVMHRNRYTAGEFIAQRFAHGKEFGLSRGRERSLTRKLLLIFLAPGIFPVLMYKRVIGSRQKPELRKQLKGAWVWLAIFTLAWAAGETCGYFTSLKNKRPQT
jgi:hypothetical protein